MLHLWLKVLIDECNTGLKVAQSCPTLYDPMDCSLPGSSVHGILQARILEWVAIHFSWRSSQPKDRNWVSCISGRFFTIWATREAWMLHCRYSNQKETSRSQNQLPLLQKGKLRPTEGQWFSQDNSVSRWPSSAQKFDSLSPGRTFPNTSYRAVCNGLSPNQLEIS